MANRVIMAAMSAARAGRSIQDVRELVDCRFPMAPDYIKADAEQRASHIIAMKSPVDETRRRRSGSRGFNGPRFPSRGERRNDFFGRKDVGNTSPEQRERTPFQYHPNSWFAEEQRMSTRRKQERERAQDAHEKVAEMSRKGFNPLAMMLAVLGVTGRGVPLYRTPERNGRTTTTNTKEQEP